MLNPLASLRLNKLPLVFALLFLQFFTVFSGVLSSCSVADNAKMFAILNIVCSGLLALPVLGIVKEEIKMEDKIAVPSSLLMLALSCWITSVYVRIWKGKLPSNFLKLDKNVSGEAVSVNMVVGVLSASILLASLLSLVSRDK